MKAILLLLVAGSLAACGTTQSRNQITITTNDGQRVALEDSAMPSTAREGVVMAKIAP
jgi:hypothetical protein